MPNPETITAISAADLYVQLPPLPEGFERELSDIGSMNGKPMFKIVDGQKEMKFRNGKMDIKHLLNSDKMPCYVPVLTEAFRRKNNATGEYQRYPSAVAAKNDTNPDLAEIEVARNLSVRAVGRPCWIIEVYISPDEISETAWDEMRYQWKPVMGKPVELDVLGPFPREGMYIYCFSVLGEHGEAIAPNATTLNECRRRWAGVQEKAIMDAQDTDFTEHSMEEFEKRQCERIADNVYQHMGISAKRLHHGVISKPLIQRV